MASRAKNSTKAAMRNVKSPEKTGTISRTAITRAVRKVVTARSIQNKANGSHE